MGMNYTPGTSSDPVPVPIRPGSSVKVGVIPLVCFEDVVGSWVRRFVRPEPQVLVNVTNDGWFNRSWANEQHWRNAAFPVHGAAPFHGPGSQYGSQRGPGPQRGRDRGFAGCLRLPLHQGRDDRHASRPAARR